MEGTVAHDAHVFCNQFWTFIKDNYCFHAGWCLPSWFYRFRVRVDHSGWTQHQKSRGKAAFPPLYVDPTAKVSRQRSDSQTPDAEQDSTAPKATGNNPPGFEAFEAKDFAV